MSQPERISCKLLVKLEERLCDRDKEILVSLLKCRYLTTGQIERLHFKENISHTAALRAANRGLAKLQGYGLIEALRRRIGGVRAGSGAYVWTLTTAGAKLLHLNGSDDLPRKRFFEPSSAFLEHTLAVSETYLQLIEICASQKLELIKAELEPVCWRRYTEDGSSTILKPDLFSVTAAGTYEDAWFLEMDLEQLAELTGISTMSKPTDTI